jgi:hypothetical protein
LKVSAIRVRVLEIVKTITKIATPPKRFAKIGQRRLVPALAPRVMSR